MTTSLFKRLLPILPLLTGFSVIEARAQAPAPSARNRCSNIDPSAERECLGRRMAGKEREMSRLYARALAALRTNDRRHGRDDRRMSPIFLQRSQAAWRQFVNADCTVRAAYGGGSNSSISDRETGCREGEIDRRIAFLRQLATETGIFGP